MRSNVYFIAAIVDLGTLNTIRSDNHIDCKHICFGFDKTDSNSYILI